MSIRPLNVEDMMLASEILDGMISGMSEEEISKLMSGKSDASSIGISVVRAAIKHARTPAFEFLASVNEMSIEEFKKKPASLITETVKEIISNPENADFFRELRTILPSA